MQGVIISKACLSGKVERTSLRTHEITLKATLADLSDSELAAVLRWRLGEELNVYIAPEQLDLIDYINGLEANDHYAVENTRLRNEISELRKAYCPNSFTQPQPTTKADQPISMTDAQIHLQNIEHRALYAALHAGEGAEEFIAELCSQPRIYIEIADAIAQLWGEEARSGDIEETVWVAYKDGDEPHLSVGDVDVTGAELVSLTRDVLEIPLPETTDGDILNKIAENGIKACGGGCDTCTDICLDHSVIDRAQAENAIYDALMAAPGAKERWAELIGAGATNTEIEIQLDAEFSQSACTHRTNGLAWNCGSGLPHIRPWFCLVGGQYKNEGNELVSTVRSILNIPYPDEADFEGTEPDTIESPAEAEAAETATESAGMVVVSETLGDEIVEPFLDPDTPSEQIIGEPESAPLPDLNKIGVGSIITRDLPEGGTPLLLIQDGEEVKHMRAEQVYRIWPHKDDDKIDLFRPFDGENATPVVIARSQVVNYQTVKKSLGGNAQAKSAQEVE